jgi:hypothetical protein
MKKIHCTWVTILLVAVGLVISNCDNKKETTSTSPSKPMTASDKKAIVKKWEATPSGIKYNHWKTSTAGKKVFASTAKIRKSINEYTNLEAVVTSLSLPPGSMLGFGLMIRIHDEDYILAVGPEKSISNSNIANEFTYLHRLKVNDKIMIRSHFVSHAPKYSYPIIAGDCVELNGKTIYKRIVRKGGC